MFPLIPVELAMRNNELLADSRVPSEDDVMDWYNQARGKAVDAVLAEFKASHPSHANTLTEFEEFLERGEDEAGFAFMTSAQSTVAAFHRGVDAAKDVIRSENLDRVEPEYIKATLINAIARKCGTDSKHFGLRKDRDAK